VQPFIHLYKDLGNNYGLQKYYRKLYSKEWDNTTLVERQSLTIPITVEAP
jgi:hypothetical protein